MTLGLSAFSPFVPVTNGGLLGQGLPSLYTPPPPKWIAVRQRFEQFHRNLSLTTLQLQHGLTKRAGVVGCLNRHYYDYGTSSDVHNSFTVGSWGKSTAIRPPRDVDLYFLLPPEVYRRFQSHVWNPQSALLQEVKAVVSVTYPNTDTRPRRYSSG